jgi:large subunit ribosomal protein L21
MKNIFNQFFKRSNSIRNFSLNKYKFQEQVETEILPEINSVNKYIIGTQIEKVTLLKDIFAVVQMGGKQYKITPSDTITVERIMADVGASIHLNKILLLGGKDFTLIGRPILSNVNVVATVEQQRTAEKIIVFKKKKRRRYRRWNGHAQQVTVLRIEDIQFERPNPKNSRVVSIE